MPEPQFVNICHRDQGKPEWKEITINSNALAAHLAHQWGADIYPVPEGGCPVIEEPTDEPTNTSEPSATPTVEEPTATVPAPTDEPTATLESTLVPTEVGEPTDEATPTVSETTQAPEQTPTAGPTQVVRRQKECEAVEVGRWFYLTGPDGQTGRLASFQINPNNGRWSIPRVEAQAQCLGFVAVNAQAGELIFKNCDGSYSSYCWRCQGGGPLGVYDRKNN